MTVFKIVTTARVDRYYEVEAESASAAETLFCNSSGQHYDEEVISEVVARVSVVEVVPIAQMILLDRQPGPTTEELTGGIRPLKRRRYPWYNYRTKKHDYRELPQDHADALDYLSQLPGVGRMMKTYQECNVPVDKAMMRILGIYTGTDEKECVLDEPTRNQ